MGGAKRAASAALGFWFALGLCGCSDATSNGAGDRPADEARQQEAKRDPAPSMTEAEARVFLQEHTPSFLEESGAPAFVEGPRPAEASGEFPYSGSGVKEYRYPSGAIKLRERYRDGEVTHSTWYRPNGDIAYETKWEDGAGTAYFLRDDGSLEAVMEAQDGMAHGKMRVFDESGELIEIRVFHMGELSETRQADGDE